MPTANRHNILLNELYKRQMHSRRECLPNNACVFSRKLHCFPMKSVHYMNTCHVNSFPCLEPCLLPNYETPTFICSWRFFLRIHEEAFPLVVYFSSPWGLLFSSKHQRHLTFYYLRCDLIEFVPGMSPATLASIIFCFRSFMFLICECLRL